MSGSLSASLPRHCFGLPVAYLVLPWFCVTAKSPVGYKLPYEHIQSLNHRTWEGQPPVLMGKLAKARWLFSNTVLRFRQREQVHGKFQR